MQRSVPNMPSASTTPSTVLPVLPILPSAPPPLHPPFPSNGALALDPAPPPSDAMQLLAATVADTMVPVLPMPQPVLGGSPERDFWNVVLNTDEPVRTRGTKRKHSSVEKNTGGNANVGGGNAAGSGSAIATANVNAGANAGASASSNSGRPWICDRCEASFALKGHLTQHIKYVHFKVRPHPCPRAGCGAAFGTQFARNQHVWTVHERLKPFVCACGAKFGQRSHLNRHMKRCDQ